MSTKTQPTGICDLCGGPIPVSEWYTSKGKPRLYCSFECKQTANSRAGAEERSRKTKRRVAEGTWVNPRSLMTPEQIHAAQSRASRKARLGEIGRGAWRNPALSDDARAKISAQVQSRAFFRRGVDVQTSPSSIIIRAALLPPGAHRAHVVFVAGRLFITPASGAHTRAIWFYEERARITCPALIRELGIPTAEWKCAMRENTLAFEKIEQPAALK